MISQDPSRDHDLKAAQKRAALSVALNGLLTIFKGFYGLKSGSTALLGDAIHSATDVVASAAALTGLSLARRRHPEFNYGLYKAETLAALASSVAILIAGYEIARQAIFGEPSQPNTAVALPVAAISFLVTLLFGLLQVRAGKRFASPALVADGKDYLADAMSTAVVMASLAAAHIGYNLDRIGALVVSLFVFKAGLGLLFGAMRELMDVAVDRETEEAIRRLVMACPAVREIEHFMSRMAGGRVIVDIDVIMSTPDHEEADRLADGLEEEIVARFPRVVMARVRPHFSPAGDRVVVTPVSGPGGSLFKDLQSAPWFLVERRDAKSGRVVTRQYVENPFVAGAEGSAGQTGDKSEIGAEEMAAWLLSLRPTEVRLKAGIEDDCPVSRSLKRAGVRIVQG